MRTRRKGDKTKGHTDNDNETNARHGQGQANDEPKTPKTDDSTCEKDKDKPNTRHTQNKTNTRTQDTTRQETRNKPKTSHRSMTITR